MLVGVGKNPPFSDVPAHCPSSHLQVHNEAMNHRLVDEPLNNQGLNGMEWTGSTFQIRQFGQLTQGSPKSFTGL